MNCVTTPIVPSVAMKAAASGMPAKLAATPENVVSPARGTAGRALADRRVREQQPEHGAEEGGDEADLDAVLECLR